MKPLLLAALLCVAPLAEAQSRAGTNEWSLNLFAIGPKHYAFEGGASARNDGGLGVGLSTARNLNDYFAIGLDLTLSEFEYRAGVAPGGANGGAGFSSEGEMESIGFRVHGTWNLLARPLTPFVTAAIGVMLLEPNLDSPPPASACWIYPWYGEVCGDKAPKTTLTRLTYGLGAGLRYDLPRDQGFVRALIAGEWISFSEALSPVGYVQVRADFGLRY